MSDNAQKPWPTHADGSNKRVGEMTTDERREVFRAAAERTRAWFERPEVQAGLAAVIDAPTDRKQ